VGDRPYADEDLEACLNFSILTPVTTNADAEPESTMAYRSVLAHQLAQAQDQLMRSYVTALRDRVSAVSTLVRDARLEEERLGDEWVDMVTPKQ
jgi:hypothetical protein